MSRQPHFTEQSDLFPADPGAGLPAGFRYEPDFLSAEEHRQLAEWVTTLPLKPFEFHGFQGNRRVASFGFRYDYQRRALGAATPFPEALLALRERAAAWAGRHPDDFRQVLVNEYAPGAPIGWHKDKPQFDEIIGVSLLAPANFRLRRRRGESWDRRSLRVEPGSIYLLSGEVRHEWQHGIPPSTALRCSITLRSLSSDPARSS